MLNLSQFLLQTNKKYCNFLQNQKMSSFKIISQELYEHLQSSTSIILYQMKSLIETNNKVVEESVHYKQRNRYLEVQIQRELFRGIGLQSQVRVLQTELERKVIQCKALIQSNKVSCDRNNETTGHLKAALNQKDQLLVQNSQLLLKISIIQEELNKQNKKVLNFQSNQQHLQAQINQLGGLVEKLELKNQQAQRELGTNSELMFNLNSLVRAGNEQVQKVMGQCRLLKGQNVRCLDQIQRLKDQTVTQLQQKLNDDQVLIQQLTLTINKLHQRCAELQLDLSSQQQQQHTTPYTQLNNPNPVTTYEKNYIQLNKPSLDQLQRLKYVSICKELLLRFKTKVNNIQQQKKAMKQKYQSVTLKLNEYQYNQFKYRDKLSLYLEKIFRYEKLAQKQQNQMQRFINQFDHEFDNVIRIKQREIREKFKVEICRHQQLQKRQRQIQCEITQPQQQQQQQQHEHHLQATINNSQFQLQLSKQQLLITKTQIKHLQQSKNNHKAKAKQLQAYCYTNSIQIRRFKVLVRQLLKELQIRTNQNQLLKLNLNCSNDDDNCVGVRGSANDNYDRYGCGFGNGAMAYDRDGFQSMSVRLSARNVSNGAGRRSGSDVYQYQISEIDTDLQNHNQRILTGFTLREYCPGKQTPLGSQINNQHNRKSQKLIQSQSNLESQSYSSRQSLDCSNSSPNNSFKSQNTNKSYGIKYLFKDIHVPTQRKQDRYLLHKNSLL